MFAISFILHPSSLIPHPFRILAQQFWKSPGPAYGARGIGVTTEWTVNQSTVPEDGEILATLTVRGAANPHEITRPDLRKLSEFKDRFRQIEEVPGPAASPDAKQVSFAYRLRPRDQTVNRLPSLDFFYENTRITGRNPFMNARARGIDLTITAPAPKSTPPAQAVPLDAPDHLFAISTGPRVLDEPLFTPGNMAWALLGVLVPVAAGMWYVAWRRVYPDGARLARLRRSRVSRRALHAIQHAKHTPDPAFTIENAVLEYLRSRFPLPSGAQTPPEIGAALRAAAITNGDAEEAVHFFRKCDAARFGPQDSVPTALAPDALALIARLEAVE